MGAAGRFVVGFPVPAKIGWSGVETGELAGAGQVADRGEFAQPAGRRGRRDGLV